MAASAVLEGPREIPSIDKAQIIADCKEVGPQQEGWTGSNGPMVQHPSP